MDVSDFADACARLRRDGFAIQTARYDSENFGSWFVEFSAPVERRIIWDGKERRLTLHRCDGDTWKETWAAQDSAAQSLDCLWPNF